MITRLILQTVLWLACMGALLFGAAGTFAWPAAWWYLIEVGVLSLWLGLWLARHDPGLLAERMAPIVQRQQSRWDRFFMCSVALVWCGWLILMGFDAMRFRWSAPLPVALVSLGSLCVFLCIFICRFVFKANSYAAPVVKIQMALRAGSSSDVWRSVTAVSRHAIAARLMVGPRVRARHGDRTRLARGARRARARGATRRLCALHDSGAFSLRAVHLVAPVFA
jgi:hypothetical protein